MRHCVPGLSTVVFAASTLAAQAVPVTLTDRITRDGDTLVYAFTGLPTTAPGDGRLTLATTGTTFFDGIDLGEGLGEYMDVTADGLSLGRWECGLANDGGTLIPGATGTTWSDCMFSFFIDIAAPDLAGIIADGAVTVSLAMGRGVNTFSLELDEIAVTLDYLPAAVIPLPASVPLLAAGLGALALLRRRQSRDRA